MEALRAILRAVPKSGLDQGNFIDNFYRKIRENDDTFVGFIGGGTYNFRKDFLIAGFDVNIVARKIGVDGSQYGGDIGRFMDLGVDKQALLDGMTLGRDGRIFSGDEKDYDRTYHVSQNIAALVEYGCDIKDIVSHIAKKYQLESFEELQQYGAGLDINELISSMNPDDVIENIEKAIELGADVDVNELLDSPELRRVWVYKIDELLALGADPQKIAAKIPPHEVGYNYRTRRFDKPPYNDLYGFRKRYPEIFRMALERVKKEVAEAA